MEWLVKYNHRFDDIWTRHENITEERGEPTFITYLSDYILVRSANLLGIYDAKTYEVLQIDTCDYDLNYGIGMLNNTLICYSNGTDKVVTVTADGITIHDIIGFDIPNLSIAGYYGFGLFYLLIREYSEHFAYLGTLTKVHLPDKIVYAFTDIVRVESDKQIIPDTSTLITPNYELVARVENNGLTLYKSTDSKEVTMNSMEELLKIATFKKDAPIEQYTPNHQQNIVAVTFDNITMAPSMILSNFLGRETVILNLIDIDRRVGDFSITRAIDMKKFKNINVAIQIETETFKIVNAALNVRHDVVALDRTYCFTIHYGMFTIYVRDDSSKISTHEYTAKNKVYLGTSRDRVYVISMRDVVPIAIDTSDRYCHV
jgi:hypothetical protein